MSIDNSPGPSSLNTPLPSTHHLKPCPNPDLWECNSEELALERNHKDQLKKEDSVVCSKKEKTILTAKKSQLEQYFTSQIPPLTKNEQDKAMKLLAHDWCENVPPVLADSLTFSEFVACISRGSFKMPGRTKVTKMIDELYEDMMLKLKDMLKQSSSVSLPTGDSYVAITGHWISSGDWITHYARLDAIATDNGVSFVAAMEDLLERMGYVKNIEFKKCPPIINLLVEDEQDDGEHQVNKGASDAAPKDASFHSSPRGHTLKLMKDVITRWNSTCYMLARCVLLEVPLRKLVEELGLEGPADNDWSTAQLLCHFMKPFQVVFKVKNTNTWQLVQERFHS
ncbi:hypothetical protein EMCRGX_G021858 [Ephydatia muelleri]